MKDSEWNLNLGTFVSLLGSGVVLFVGVTVFMFQNFQTKAEAQAESTHIKENQDQISITVDKVDLKLEKMNDKLNILLQRSK